MEDCLDGLQCIKGSCVPDSAEPEDVGTCAIDSECPSFQRCIAARCYSDCEANDDCSNGQVCAQKVCRAQCSTSQTNDCPEGFFCDAPDGVAGVCITQAQQLQNIEVEVDGTFALGATSLSFSNINTTATLTLRNDSPTSRNFIVRKLREYETTDQGVETIEEHPLTWLLLGAPGKEEKVEEYKILVEGNGEVEVGIAGAARDDQGAPARWRGELQVSAEGLGQRSVMMEYAEQPEGQWVGKQMYLASFGEEKLTEWIEAGRADGESLSDVGNALVQRWGAFKFGDLDFDEFRASLLSIETGSWNNAEMIKRCRDAGNAAGACYPYDNPAGMLTLTTDARSRPVPTGVTELPFAMNVKVGSDEVHWEGRVESSRTLHYSGNPAVSLEFAGDPSGCVTELNGVCLTPVLALKANAQVGGRHAPGADGCNEGLEPVNVPWLLRDFTQGTSGPEDELVREECRSSSVPFGSDAEQKPNNLNFAGANPVPDGLTRERTLDLVDGAMINQEYLFLLFRERFDAKLGAAQPSFYSYGYVILKKQAADLTNDAFDGAKPIEASGDPVSLAAGCDSDLVEDLLGEPLSAENAGMLADLIIDGKPTDLANIPLIDWAATEEEHAQEKVHYLCVNADPKCREDYCPDIDLGELDEGETICIEGCEYPQFFDDLDECPPGSYVRYFTATGASDADIQSWASSCLGESPADTCKDLLVQWAADENKHVRLDPIYQCQQNDDEPRPVYCDENRSDLRQDKDFFGVPEGGDTRLLPALRPAIDEAFRYRTQFRSSTDGGTLGFAPQECKTGARYCYDAAQIEQLSKRVDCAIDLFVNYELDAEPLGDLLDYLRFNFAYQTASGVTYDGFERLNSELLVMQGDEAYVKAVSSRFDLAGSSLSTFRGQDFEPNGIELSGAAGFEMVNLYAATQYYQLVLDRFHHLSPLIWADIEAKTGRESFITQGTVTAFFGRVARASAQKARVSAAIARQYQGFNRPELARRVIERTYTGAYLEGILLSRLMLAVTDRLAPEERDQVTIELVNTQRVYASAFMDMREVYEKLSDEQRYFDLPPDYIPFPVWEGSGKDAVDYQLEVFRKALDAATAKEDLALSESRGFEVSAAEFNKELRQLQINYEDQLADICGTIQPDSGGDRVPAIPKYASLNAIAQSLGNPCGSATDSQIYSRLAQVDEEKLEFERIEQRYRTIIREIDIELEKVETVCALGEEDADFHAEVAGKILKKNDYIRGSRAAIEAVKFALETTAKSLQLTKCWVIAGFANGTDCPAAITAGIAFSVAAGIATGVATINEGVIAVLEHQIEDLKTAALVYDIERKCDYAEAESRAAVKRLLLGTQELALDALKTEYRVRQIASDVDQLKSKAQRLINEQTEMEQLSIDVQAARTDPNVRIYKNDAVLTADRTFDDAAREAFKATRLLEYHFGFSYDRLNDLFLVRMATRGDISLESYYTRLEQTYRDQLEMYGAKAVTPTVVSLRDDVLQIPRYAEDGTALSQTQRTEQMRQLLTDGTLLDNQGALRIPFRTTQDRLSPRTWGHRIKFIEAEIVGSDVGDSSGRIVLQPRGTSVMRVTDELQPTAYYTFPVRDAIVNPLFNGVRTFMSDDEVYRSKQLVDRPVVNTRWDFILDQRFESVNKDINLGALTDIRLYVYYTEFAGESN